MKRVLVTLMLTFIITSLWQAFALFMPYGLNILCLPPILLAFSLQFFKPLETLWISIVCGAIIDILGGFSIGVNMVLMISVAFMLGTTNLFIGRLSLGELSLYVAALSLFYRIIFFITNIILGQKVNISFGQLIFGPLIDMIIGYVFFIILAKILILLKSFERSDFAKYGVGRV